MWGDITSLSLQGKHQVVAVFDLDERPGHSVRRARRASGSDLRGQGGKIVVWHQTDVPTLAAPGLFA